MELVIGEIIEFLFSILVEHYQLTLGHFKISFKKTWQTIFLCYVLTITRSAIPLAINGFIPPTPFKR